MKSVQLGSGSDPCHHLPSCSCGFQEPKPADFQAFRSVMRGMQGQRVFAHCAANYRVSCFVALWAELDLGWSREQADAHIQRLWQPNEVWTTFLAKMREILSLAD